MMQGIETKLEGLHVTLYQDSWKPGDTFSYITGQKGTIVPGLFVYSGFGMGYLYLPDGSKVWCDVTTSRVLCKSRGLGWEYVDSFDGYKAPAVGDW